MRIVNICFHYSKIVHDVYIFVHDEISIYEGTFGRFYGVHVKQTLAWRT